MISILFLTRNIRRAAFSRGFSNATIPTIKDVDDEKKANRSDKKPEQSKINSTKLFEKIKSIDQNVSTTTTTTTTKPPQQKSPTTPIKKDFASSLTAATTVSEVLELSEKNVNQKNAMGILTKLSMLTASKKAVVTDYENDYRFLKICQILSKSPSSGGFQKVKPSVPSYAIKKSAQVEMVLGVAGDDEASELVKTLSLSQKVRVFSSLARKKTRSIVVLKALALSICFDAANMNLKECSDLLFAMNSLNFIDDMLLTRVANDIGVGLPNNVNKMAVVGSIITSVGILKFRDTKLLDNLLKHVVAQHNLCRPKDLASFILTLAQVNYRPQNVADISSTLIPKISKSDLWIGEWLDHVWALCVLDLYESSHLESVLCPQFLEQFLREQKTEDLLPAQKMKILNINAVAKHFATEYNGPYLDPKSPVNNCRFGYRKSKKILVQGLLDTLTNLFTSTSYIRTSYDMNLGFIIDAECVLSENRTPLAIESEIKNASRVAFMVLDYYDICKGEEKQPNGIQALTIKLLEKNGYNVLLVPHYEFSTSDKVLKRVQYLDSKLKNILKQSSN
ncbi:FAST kinase domain-containing protein 4 [Contarinia nasturtii]|uniref:FAST kinase domain-containing protein 4 n=1 Tax=Contarinia nasturtii TaxID=265458 RepID=UPI0012D3FA1D|nr:FAST kinase domain-containing protein 4 [Contarinia nasturtii]